MVKLPDGSTVEERRTKRHLLERMAAEPIASITLFTVLGVMAWGILASNTRTADSAKNAEVSAHAANVNAQAAKELANTIDQAVKLLSQVGTQSRKATFDSHQAMQDTIVCILQIQPEERTVQRVDSCVRPLTPPPPDSPTSTTTTR